jgi:hypothetical protein
MDVLAKGQSNVSPAVMSAMVVSAGPNVPPGSTTTTAFVSLVTTLALATVQQVVSTSSVQTQKEATHCLPAGTVHLSLFLPSKKGILFATPSRRKYVDSLQRPLQTFFVAWRVH